MQSRNYTESSYTIPLGCDEIAELLFESESDFYLDYGESGRAVFGCVVQNGIIGHFSIN